MSYQEKRSLVSLFSSILIAVVYSAYMLQRLPQADPYSAEVLRYWGSFLLILIPVAIVAKVIIHILFSIINTISTREDEPSVTDERDRSIELKANTNSLYVFMIGFLLAMASLVVDQPPTTMFIILIAAGVLSEAVGNISEFFFYRRGF